MPVSYVKGSDYPALTDAGLSDLLDAAVSCNGESSALVVPFQNIRWTYAELSGRVDRLARGLVAAGMLPGDRIGIWAPNCAEWTLVQFASARAGLVLVNINPAYRPHELRYALRKVGCSALILAPTYKSSDYLSMLASVRHEIPDLRLVILLGGDRHIDSGDGYCSFETIAKGSDAALPAPRSPRDALNIQFTSGTTGSPKAATLSHGNIVNNGRMVAHRLALTSKDRVCIPVPLYHCFGMVMGNIACVSAGAAMIYPAPTFSPKETLETIAAEGCTAVHGVPTMFIAMLEHDAFETFDLHTLRTGIMAGAPCPIAIMKNVIERMHIPEITIAYGMTETSPVSFQSDRDDPIERRVGTVGRVQPHLEVKLVDEEGQTVPRNQRGELCTRGYSVMMGYWGQPEATAEAIDHDGWMHTGDLATMDEEEYVRIVGRLKDLVIRGGENIYPREIEEHLATMDAIADVQVFGVPDERFGEELCAWIILRTGHVIDEQAIRSYCQARIAHYKVPRYIRFVNTFPLTITGKPQKFMMRDAMIREFNTAID